MANKRFEEGFINGLFAGSAGKTVVDPSIWNDTGVYSYFYIDFLRPVQDFSIGMFTESIVINNAAAAIPPTGVERVSDSVFKIYADISTHPMGITVTNKINSLIVLTDGTKMEVFSKSFYVAGLTTYLRLKYLYEFIHPQALFSSTNEITYDLTADPGFNIDNIYETTNKPALFSSLNEKTVSVTLT